MDETNKRPSVQFVQAMNILLVFVVVFVLYLIQIELNMFQVEQLFGVNEKGNGKIRDTIEGAYESIFKWILYFSVSVNYFNVHAVARGNWSECHRR